MKKRIRIVKKTKEGCTLDLKEQGLRTMPWDVFNQGFSIRNEVWAVPKEELLQMKKEVDELVGNAMTFSFIAAHSGDTTERLAATFNLEKYISEITEKLGCTVLEAANLVRERSQALTKATTALVTGNSRRMAGEKYHKPQPIESVSRQVDKNLSKKGATNSLGDFAPGLAELREKLGGN